MKRIFGVALVTLLTAGEASSAVLNEGHAVDKPLKASVFSATGKGFNQWVPLHFAHALPQAPIDILASQSTVLSEFSASTPVLANAEAETGVKAGNKQAEQKPEVVSPVPPPAAAWLFGSAIMGFAAFATSRRAV